VSDTCTVKGVAFHTFFQALTELRGRHATDLTRAALPPALEERLRLGGIARVGQYPLDSYSELHAAAQRALSGGESLARAIGRTAADIDTRGLLRFVLGLTSTDLLMRHAGKVWSSFVRGSRVSVRQAEARHYVVDFEGLEGASELLFAELEGSIERLVERTGARQARVTRKVDPSGSSARYFVAWGE
jgi:hypothetical protein